MQIISIARSVTFMCIGAILFGTQTASNLDLALLPVIDSINHNSSSMVRAATALATLRDLHLGNCLIAEQVLLMLLRGGGVRWLLLLCYDCAKYQQPTAKYALRHTVQ